MTVWCAGLDESLIQTCTLNGHLYRVTYTRCRIDTINSPDGVQVWMRLIQTCTPNGHLYRVTHAKCRTDTINSPDDGHMAARNT